MCRYVACWQNDPNMQRLTSPNFSGSDKIGPGFPSDVSLLAFPQRALAMTAGFRPGPLLGIPNLGNSDVGLGYADDLDELCFRPYAYIANAGCTVIDVQLLLSG